MDSRTRHNAIVQFIEDNPDCTKTQVVDAMAGKVSSLVVTHKILKELERDGKIIVKPDELNPQTHRLTINDKSEYFQLKDKINELKRRINKLARFVSWRLHVKKMFKNTKMFESLKQDYLNLLHYAQIDSYSKITSIATRIDKNIKSRDDQERLKLKLTEVLNVSNKLNEMLAPQVELELEKLLDKMKNEQEPVQGLITANMIKEIAGLFASKGQK